MCDLLELPGITVFSTIKCAEEIEGAPCVALFEMTPAEVDLLHQAIELTKNGGFDDISFKIAKTWYFLDSGEEMYLSFEDLLNDETGFDFKYLKSALGRAKDRVRVVHMMDTRLKVSKGSAVFEASLAWTDVEVMCRSQKFDPEHLISSESAAAWLHPFAGQDTAYLAHQS